MQPVYSRSYRSTTGHNNHHHSPKDSNVLTNINNNNCNSQKRKERENAKTPRRKSESSINTNPNKKCGARAAKRRKNNSETPEALLIASQTIQATIAAGFPPLSTSSSTSASLPAQPCSSPASLNSSNYYYSALGLQLSMQDLSRFMHAFCTQYWPLAPLPGSLIGESSLRYAMSPSGQEEKGMVTLSINFALCIGAYLYSLPLSLSLSLSLFALSLSLLSRSLAGTHIYSQVHYTEATLKRQSISSSNLEVSSNISSIA